MFRSPEPHLVDSPAHLLFNSKSLLDPSRLPPKWLLIAGGKDDQVNYSQSVLMRLLLIGVGLEEVRLRLYQEETHIGCMTSEWGSRCPLPAPRRVGS